MLIQTGIPALQSTELIPESRVRVQNTDRIRLVLLQVLKHSSLTKAVADTGRRTEVIIFLSLTT